MESLATELEAHYTEFGPQFFGCALAVTGCGALAEDAVHNAFSRAFNLKQCPQNLKGYLFRSVRNAAIDLMRKQNRSIGISAEMVFECDPEQYHWVDRREQLDSVAAALTRLSSDERETLMQHLVAHLTFQEIAGLRKRPMGTITSWYRRGLTKLRKQLNHEA